MMNLLWTCAYITNGSTLIFGRIMVHYQALKIQSSQRIRWIGFSIVIIQLNSFWSHPVLRCCILFGSSPGHQKNIFGVL